MLGIFKELDSKTIFSSQTKFGVFQSEKYFSNTRYNIYNAMVDANYCHRHGFDVNIMLRFVTMCYNLHNLRVGACYNISTLLSSSVILNCSIIDIMNNLNT